MYCSSTVHIYAYEYSYFHSCRVHLYLHAEQAHPRVLSLPGAMTTMIAVHFLCLRPTLHGVCNCSSTAVARNPQPSPHCPWRFPLRSCGACIIHTRSHQYIAPGTAYRGIQDQDRLSKGNKNITKPTKIQKRGVIIEMRGNRREWPYLSYIYPCVVVVQGTRSLRSLDR